ncbi:MAG: hypothetical protein ACW99G_03600 [Candidatus Thorarchaeota archaeon]|jgi:F0F1-type ATP synthase gamma subunit
MFGLSQKQLKSLEEMNDDMDFKNFADKLRNCEETEETTDLHLTRDEFMTKMYQEKNGQELLDLLESGEHRICERMGLSNAYYEGDTAYIDVPRWNNLVAHLNLVNG